MAATVTGFPVPKYRFKVSIDGADMSFQEVTGLDQEADHLEYRTGDDKEISLMKRAGMVKTGTLSLKRGVVTDVKKELSDLMKKMFDEQKYQSEADAGDLLTIMVSLLDEKEAIVITWKIEEAFPVKLVGTTLKADENQVAIEQMDFMFRRLKIE